MAKIEIPDIHKTVAVFSTSVKETNETDWQNLVIIIKYLNSTKKKYLTLCADGLKLDNCYVEASFAVHPDFKSHTRAIMTMGQREIQSLSQ